MKSNWFPRSRITLKAGGTPGRCGNFFIRNSPKSFPGSDDGSNKRQLKMNKSRKEIRWTNGPNTIICRRNIWQKYGCKRSASGIIPFVFCASQTCFKLKETFYAAKPKYSHTKMSGRASIITICNHNKISKKTSPSFISKVVMRVFDGVANIYRNCDISGNRLWLSKYWYLTLAKKIVVCDFWQVRRLAIRWLDFPRGKCPAPAPLWIGHRGFRTFHPFFLHNLLSLCQSYQANWTINIVYCFTNNPKVLVENFRTMAK